MLCCRKTIASGEDGEQEYLSFIKMVAIEIYELHYFEQKDADAGITGETNFHIAELRFPKILVFLSRRGGCFSSTDQ